MTATAKPSALVRREETPENPIGLLIQKMAENATPESAATIRELAALYRETEADNARKAFTAARCAMGQALPRIVAKKPVPDAQGNVKYVYAPFEDIMAAIDPFLAEHGFAISFSARFEASERIDRIIAICKLTHIQGHSETNEFAVRVSAPPKANDAQADGATLTYAKRFALCMMLNLAIDHDSDARIEGDYLPSELADSLKARVKATGSDESKFLKLARAESFDKIRRGVYAQLDFLLKQKEKTQAEENAAGKESKDWADNAIPEKQ